MTSPTSIPTSHHETNHYHRNEDNDNNNKKRSLHSSSDSSSGSSSNSSSSSEKKSSSSSSISSSNNNGYTADRGSESSSDNSSNPTTTTTTATAAHPTSFTTAKRRRVSVRFSVVNKIHSTRFDESRSSNHHHHASKTATTRAAESQQQEDNARRLGWLCDLIAQLDNHRHRHTDVASSHTSATKDPLPTSSLLPPSHHHHPPSSYHPKSSSHNSIDHRDDMVSLEHALGISESPQLLVEAHPPFRIVRANAAYQTQYELPDVTSLPPGVQDLARACFRDTPGVRVRPVRGDGGVSHYLIDVPTANVAAPLRVVA